MMNDLIVESYAPNYWPRVTALLRDGARSLIGHADWPYDGLVALHTSRVAARLQSPETVAWIVQSNSATLGLAILSALPWDSEQLGLSAGRLDYLLATGVLAEQTSIKKTLVAKMLQHCADHGIQHLSARLHASDLSGLHVLEQSGFITVDALLTFAVDLRSISFEKPADSVFLRLATPDDSAAVADLARHSYIYDRFHSDPVIARERADELHATWLRNSCTGRAADAVVLAEDQQGVLGFVTCKLQRDTKAYLGKSIGTIVLVATAEHARREGVARAATLAALDWFRQQDTDVVEVGTQLRNIPASRLYESCGFRLVGSSLSLRIDTQERRQ